MVDGRSEQLHHGSIYGWFQNWLEMRNSLLHSGLRTDRQGFLRDPTRFFRSGSDEGNVVYLINISTTFLLHFLGNYGYVEI